jgi:hypothetical protein
LYFDYLVLIPKPSEQRGGKLRTIIVLAAAKFFSMLSFV